MNNRLSLEIPETLNSCLLRLQDSSTYVPDVPVTCARLQVSIPGFKNSIYVDDVNPGFSLNLTACDLKIQKDNCYSSYNDLPDGIYVVNWSISPNDVVFVEYDHLRVTKGLNKIKSLMCDLDLLNCAPSPQLKKMRSSIAQAQEYLMGAKAAVEYCRRSSQGLEMYKQAMKILDKMNCKNCH